MRHRLIRVLAVLIVLTVPSTPAPSANAQQGSPAEQLIYWPYVTNGGEYRRVAYPTQVDTIRVLADTPIVLEPRRTTVAYWPLTGEYLADLANRNEPVAGDLEVVTASGEVRRVPPRPYTIWYPNGVGAGESVLLVDEVAQSVYAKYVADATKAAQDEQAYAARVAELQAAVDAWLKLAASRVTPLPPPPAQLTEAPPEPYSGYAAEIAETPVVSLPAGAYTIRWRGPDGSIVPGSERRLVSFSARRQAVGYRLLPENRWTQPVDMFNPDEVLYLEGSTSVYLQPILVEEYNTSLYVRVYQPQLLDAPDPSLFTWVPRGPLQGTRLEVRQGQQKETVPELPYRVEQNAGTNRGYTIRPLAESDATVTPDFSAMRVRADMAPATQLALVNSAGNEVTGSRRDVRRVAASAGVLVYAPALLPLLLLLVTRLRRRGPATKETRAS
ncbi:MAG: hypothetical protein HYX52_02395 [Chloroflexi bacterium]|nr:hypothetical protein [Chloroflexota bacterium]